MINGSAHSRSSDLSLEFTIQGELLTGAKVIAYFKPDLHMADVLAIKKGSALPLTGIVLTTATDTRVVAVVTLTKEELTSLPNDVFFLFYDVKLIDSAGFTWQIENGRFGINKTAKASA